MLLLIDLKNPFCRVFSFHSGRTIDIIGSGRCVEKESEYMLAHTRLWGLDARPPGEAWVRVEVTLDRL